MDGVDESPPGGCTMPENFEVFSPEGEGQRIDFEEGEEEDEVKSIVGKMTEDVVRVGERLRRMAEVGGSEALRAVLEEEVKITEILDEIDFIEEKSGGDEVLDVARGEINDVLTTIAAIRKREQEQDEEEAEDEEEPTIPTTPPSLRELPTSVTLNIASRMGERGDGELRNLRCTVPYRWFQGDSAAWGLVSQSCFGSLLTKAWHDAPTQWRSVPYIWDDSADAFTVTKAYEASMFTQEDPAQLYLLGVFEPDSPRSAGLTLSDLPPAERIDLDDPDIVINVATRTDKGRGDIVNFSLTVPRSWLAEPDELVSESCLGGLLNMSWRSLPHWWNDTTNTFVANEPYQLSSMGRTPQFYLLGVWEEDSNSPRYRGMTITDLPHPISPNDFQEQPTEVVEVEVEVEPQPQPDVFEEEERPVQGPDWEGLVSAFYELHNPEKLSTVHLILTKYQGEEPRLWSMLLEKYGLNEENWNIPRPAVPATPVQTQATPHPETTPSPVIQQPAPVPVQVMHVPVSSPMPVAAAVPVPVPVPVTVASLPPQEQPPAIDWEARLVEFYTMHNPEKVKKVPQLLSQFSGEEENLWNALQNKYAQQQPAQSPPTEHHTPAPEPTPTPTPTPTPQPTQPTPSPTAWPPVTKPTPTPTRKASPNLSKAGPSPVRGKPKKVQPPPKEAKDDSPQPAVPHDATEEELIEQQIAELQMKKEILRKTKSREESLPKTEPLNASSAVNAPPARGRTPKKIPTVSSTPVTNSVTPATKRAVTPTGRGARAKTPTGVRKQVPRQKQPVRNTPVQAPVTVPQAEEPKPKEQETESERAKKPVERESKAEKQNQPRWTTSSAPAGHTKKLDKKKFGAPQGKLPDWSGVKPRTAAGHRAKPTTTAPTPAMQAETPSATPAATPTPATPQPPQEEKPRVEMHVPQYNTTYPDVTPPTAVLDPKAIREQEKEVELPPPKALTSPVRSPNQSGVTQEVQEGLPNPLSPQHHDSEQRKRSSTPGTPEKPYAALINAALQIEPQQLEEEKLLEVHEQMQAPHPELPSPVPAVVAAPAPPARRTSLSRGSSATPTQTKKPFSKKSPKPGAKKSSVGELPAPPAHVSTRSRSTGAGQRKGSPSAEPARKVFYQAPRPRSRTPNRDPMQDQVQMREKELNWKSPMTHGMRGPLTAMEKFELSLRERGAEKEMLLERAEQMRKAESKAGKILERQRVDEEERHHRLEVRLEREEMLERKREDIRIQREMRKRATKEWQMKRTTTAPGHRGPHYGSTSPTAYESYYAPHYEQPPPFNSPSRTHGTTYHVNGEGVPVWHPDENTEDSHVQALHAQHRLAAAGHSYSHDPEDYEGL